MLRNSLILLSTVVISLSAVEGFIGVQQHQTCFSTHPTDVNRAASTTNPQLTTLFRQNKKEQFRSSSKSRQFLSSSNNNGENGRYSREIYLREEAESPFRKVRFFFYTSLGCGALISFAVSMARIAAGLNGINADLLQESSINAAVDAGGLAVLAFAYQRDLVAQESRLKRASKGGELAKLMVRGSKSMIIGEDMMGEEEEESANDSNPEMLTTSLASLRRGRGIEKRVVIVAAGSEKIAQVLLEAAALQESLVLSDLLIVPVVLPGGVAPQISSEDGDNITNVLPDCVALPVGSSWKTVVGDEAEEAMKQGVDVKKEGMCVILKKNGKVGQRTKGIFLKNMVGEVEERKALGMDVTNI
mmetsp:Transcript_20666/g.26665  ORF Transcript_20666/g.26665 Transcript_20666/m.26665 type:complete len:359 (+) Transcript_20666:52-1128(+)